MSEINEIIDGHLYKGRYKVMSERKNQQSLRYLARLSVGSVEVSGECVYYHKAHVLCNDGVERDISELPKEALDFTGTSVTAKYGINVGGQCELEKNCGYAEDKSVFRNPNDFCSRGERSGENV